MEAQNISYDVCRLYIEDTWPNGGLLYQKISGFLRSRDIERLSSCQTLWDAQLHSFHDFRTLRQVAAFFKKNADFSDAKRCKQNAIEAFLKAETRCSIANKRLDYYHAHPGRLDPDMSLWMSKIERFCATVLGDFEVFLEELPKRIRVTDGATATRGRRDALPYLKVGKKISCTPGAYHYLNALSQYFGYGAIKMSGILWNRVLTVRKNWSTDRTIAGEPDGNMPLQLAGDTWMKDRLRSFGINLSDQSENQELARLGSCGLLKIATIDIQQASDSTAVNAVAWCFPTPWFDFLTAVRSPFYRLEDGDRGTYAKFSSMGNGSTFAIETLIFAAAINAIGSKTKSVYGDDIIVDSDKVEDLTRVLAFLGFSINKSKSYASGPFRESCGADWFDGRLVTPFYIRVTPKRKSQWCHLVNGLSAISEPHGKLWGFLRDLIVEKRLPFVPWNLDSMSGVHVDVSTAYRECIIKSKLKEHMWIPVFKAYTVKPVKAKNWDTRSLFLWHLDTFRVRGKRTKVDRGQIHSRIDKRLVRFIDREDRFTDSSSDPTFAFNYERKWVCWHPPAMVTPGHIYMWSDFVCPAAVA